MKCSKCQFENREGAIFCRSCGKLLESDISCPNCEASNPADSTFCEKCGQNLKSPKVTFPIKYSEPQSYTPKFLADKILTTRSTIEGERKLVTVLFADVANYTALSEKLDPEEVHQIMDGCFKIMIDEVHRYEGTINQFTGDGVMALFGAPISHEDHAQRGCNAALSIQKAMNEYSKKLKKSCDIVFKLRIGLNSGPVVVGAIGDDLRMDYTAVGDTTNLAMRMESMTEPGDIQISENTYRLIKAYFDCEDLGSVPVKGKKEPQQTYKLIKTGEAQTRFEASMSKGLVRFVGRKNSMAAINSAWNKAVERAGQVLGVVGEAGVGKSRLLLEFRHSLTNSDFNYLEGRCLHYGGSMAYLPFLDIVKTFFGIEEGQHEDFIIKTIEEKLTTLDKELLLDSQPAFQELLSLKVEGESWLKLEPQIKRERTFEALRNLLIRFSEEKPLIIAVEDLHWMDKTSEEFLGYLIDSMANSPILLILLYRPEYTHQWGSKSYYSKIGLDQLTMKTSGELVSAILEGGEVASELKELILSRSAGNPLFMEEFTHTLLENGSIERRNSQFVLNRKISDIQVPDTIQGIIAARMDRLEENLKRTMQVASVIGRDFAFRILQTITGMREELKSYLINLQGLEFIYEKSLFPDLEYIFKHALTQEVAYNSLLVSRRKKIHERIGKAIEELYSNRLEELYEMLAYHYSKSDNLEKAYQYLKLSGQKATGNYSYIESFGFFKDAIKHLDRMPDNKENRKEQISVRLQISTPAFALSFPEDTLNILQVGEQIAKKNEDNKSLALFYTNIGHYYNMMGNRSLALKYQENSFDNAWKIQDIDMIAAAAFSLVSAYMGTDKYKKIIDVASRVLPLMEDTKINYNLVGLGEINLFSLIHGYYGWAEAFLGQIQNGIVICKKGLRLARESNDILSTSLMEYFLGWLYYEKGDFKNAMNQLESSLNYCQEANHTIFLGLLWSSIGYAYLQKGDSNTAIRYIKKGLKLQVSAGRQGLLSSIYYYLGSALLASDNLKEALQATEKGLELARKNNEKINEGQLMMIKGVILSKKEPSRWQDAGKIIQKGIEILVKLETKLLYPRGYLLLGELYIESDQRRKAMECLKKAKEKFQDMGLDYWLNKTQVVLDRL